MRSRPPVTAHRRPGIRHTLRRTFRQAVLPLIVGLACEGAWAQRANRPPADVPPGGAGALDGTGQRDGVPGGAGPAGGRGFGRGRGDQPTGTAVIRGRVITQDTGAPLRRAQVRAGTTGFPFGRITTTDADGRFELRDLPAGQWTLVASKPGYVTQRLGQRRPFETVQAVEIQDGQQLNAANFALARGGVITGRLFDDDGDPVAAVRMQVLRRQTIEGRRRLTLMGVSDETDDTGSFRLYGLAPGDYYVSAVLRAGPQESMDRAGYAPTYFPGTGHAAEAQRIHLGAGEEMAISFGLLPVRTGRISGTVVSATGPAPAGGIVVLTSTELDAMGVVAGTGGRIEANGAFTIANVVPGSYVLMARTGDGRRGAGRNAAAAEVGMFPVSLAGEDLTGITIVTTQGAAIEGSVVAADGSRPKLDGVRVTARPVRASSQAFSSLANAAHVSAAGTFLLSSLVGPVTLHVDGLPPQWVLKSIDVGGADVIDTPLELKGTEQITGVRITLTDRVAEINGTATRGSAPAKDFSVVIFADNEARWTFPTRFVRSVRGNQQGNFTVRGLPPGVTYLAAAVGYLEDGDIQDPEFLAGLKERASSLSLREGETKTIELRVIER